HSEISHNPFQLILSVFHPRPSLFRVGLERRSPPLETATETDSLMWQSPPPMPEKGVWFIFVEGSKVDSSHLLRRSQPLQLPA
ncbi:hypothetical protein GBAR_LOCUS3241, partial [Geodia barretti]